LCVVIKSVYLALLLVFYAGLSAFGQWSPVSSGTTNNLNGSYLLGSGTGFIVGEAGTILKTTDLGGTWAALASGTTTTLHGVYLFDPNEGVPLASRDSFSVQLMAGLVAKRRQRCDGQSSISLFQRGKRNLRRRLTNDLLLDGLGRFMADRSNGIFWRRLSRRSYAECNDRFTIRMTRDLPLGRKTGAAGSLSTLAMHVWHAGSCACRRKSFGVTEDCGAITR
jgi:hypothetical protein